MKDISYYMLCRKEVFALLKRKPKRILEIGCAAGCFRRNFEEVEYWGVEPVREVAEIARGSLTKVLVGCYDDVKFQIPDAYFDLVVCNDVIEHMANPLSFLIDVKDKLKNGGCLLGSVPNVRYLPVMFGYMVLRDWRYNPKGGVLDETHLRFFTKKSFTRMAGGIDGYSIEVVRFITSPCYRLAKLLLSLVVWPIGLDVLMGQIGFRLRKVS